MNKDTLVILAATALGLWYVTKMTRPAGAGSAMTLNNAGNVSIPNTLKQAFEITVPNGQAGWHYYNDGTAVGPDGAKYGNIYY